MRRTKIVVTLGPASELPEVLRRLLQAGVDIVRLNFSHGDLEQKRTLIEGVRIAAAELGRTVSILQDLQGPKIRVGRLAGGSALLEEGRSVLLRPDDGGEATAGRLTISYPRLAAIVREGAAVFLDDGLMELRVVGVSGDEVEAEVVRGGVLLSHKGVNLPGAQLDLPPLTAKDEADLRFGLARGVDMVALSFVRHESDAARARQIIAEEGGSPLLIAKIEKQEAVARLPQLLQAFDAVMVARGDLGVELSVENVPAVQKQIIAAARSAGRPVITATQMLESMTHHPRPTRAEASDVANAVLDGTDCVMLSGETAVGAYPVETVRVMDRIVRAAEVMPAPAWTEGTANSSQGDAICQAAIHLAEDLQAFALTALTWSGRTAQTLSRLGARVPILAFIWGDEAQARRLNLWRGVIPIVLPREEVSDAAAVILREVRARSLVPPGSRLVLVGASGPEPEGTTDFIRLLTV